MIAAAGAGLASISSNAIHSDTRTRLQMEEDYEAKDPAIKKSREYYAKAVQGKTDQSKRPSTKCSLSGRIRQKRILSFYQSAFNQAMKSTRKEECLAYPIRQKEAILSKEGEINFTPAERKKQLQSVTTNIERVLELIPQDSLPLALPDIARNPNKPDRHSGLTIVEKGVKSSESGFNRPGKILLTNVVTERRLMEFYTECGSIYTALGDVSKESNDLKQAKEAYRKAIIYYQKAKKFDEAGSLYEKLGDLSVNNNDFTQATAEYAAAVANFDPKDPNKFAKAYEKIGDVALATGNKKKAKAEYFTAGSYYMRQEEPKRDEQGLIDLHQKWKALQAPDKHSSYFWFQSELIQAKIRAQRLKMLKTGNTPKSE